jgi:hypothetical protein
MAIPGLVAASNLADTENKEAVWDNLGNGIEAVILATNSLPNNTMVGAVTGTPGTLPTNWIVAGSGGDIVQEIVGTGSEDGIFYLDIRFSGTPTATTFLSIQFAPSTQIAASNGQIWSASNYIKLAAGSIANVLLRARVDVNSDSDTLEIFDSTLNPTPASLITQRQGLQLAITNASAAFIRPTIRLNYTSGLPFDITLRIGMPQLERGEYITPPIATTNAAASALATVPLSIKGDDILELTGARLAATSDFVRIKGLTTLAQARLTTAAANVASGIALRDNALLKASPSSEGDYFLSRGALDGQSLRVNGLNIASLSGSPFSGSTASCPLLISSFAAPTNLRLDNAMASGTLTFPEKAIPIETDQFIFYAKAGQS